MFVNSYKSCFFSRQTVGYAVTPDVRPYVCPHISETHERITLILHTHIT